MNATQSIYAQRRARLASMLGAGGIAIKTVMRGGAAERAGLAAGDEWLGIELPPARRGAVSEAWRVTRLDEVEWLLGGRPRLMALVSRDRRLLRAPLDWPEPVQAVRLSVGDAARTTPWLAGH